MTETPLTFVSDSPFTWRTFIQIPRDDFDDRVGEIKDWCRHTYGTDSWTVETASNWYCSWTDGVGGWIDQRETVCVEFYFADEGDAALFTLRWL